MVAAAEFASFRQNTLLNTWNVDQYMGVFCDVYRVKAILLKLSFTDG